MAHHSISRVSPRMRMALDACVLLIILGTAAALFLHGQAPVTTPWDWNALARAFFRYEEGRGILPGPLGTGLITTLRLIFWSFWLTALVGLGLGLLRASRVRSFRMIGTVFVTINRNLPPLVLVFIIHFFVSSALTSHINWSFIDNLPFFNALLPHPNRMGVFVSALITLSIYEGAYMGEIVRAGIASIHTTQWEAAKALGLSRVQQIRLVIMPQAFRMMIPPLTGQATSLIKDSAIVSVISVQELTFQGTEFMTSSGLTGETWAAVTLCYLLLCLGVSGLGRYAESRTQW